MKQNDQSRHVVKAAGGVVVRLNSDGRCEVVLVHRPAYDDWTLPKGKRKNAEKAKDCALREVEEETGLRCTAEGELPRTSYLLAGGAQKVVRWWLMSVVADHGFDAGDEVDEIRWVPIGEAAGILTYGLDAEFVRSLPEFTSR